jgi:hypothetical protein
VLSCHDNLLTSSAPHRQSNIMIHSKFQVENKILNLCPEFLLHFPKQQEDSVMVLAST